LFRRTWQSPSNAHAYRLYVFNEPARSSSFAPSFLANLAAISEAFDYDSFYEDLSNSAVFASGQQPQSPPVSQALDSIPNLVLFKAQHRKL